MWIDALSNYVTTNHGLCFHHVNHVFGKDILKFHGYLFTLFANALSKCVDLCCFLRSPSSNENDMSQSIGRSTERRLVRVKGTLSRFVPYVNMLQ